MISKTFIGAAALTCFALPALAGNLETDTLADGPVDAAIDCDDAANAEHEVCLALPVGLAGVTNFAFVAPAVLGGAALVGAVAGSGGNNTTGTTSTTGTTGTN
ncbi:hypothetical protein ACFSUD_08475 [Sulfitobacter aestuarii]|uniref:Uncharacterized protein n=1 Tax=Sulfitobacter aestuarii TaxID=2161676 RepID=A0ABW5U1F0_9RHOB